MYPFERPTYPCSNILKPFDGHFDTKLCLICPFDIFIGQSYSLIYHFNRPTYHSNSLIRYTFLKCLLIIGNIIVYPIDRPTNPRNSHLYLFDGHIGPSIFNVTLYSYFPLYISTDPKNRLIYTFRLIDHRNSLIYYCRSTDHTYIPF